MNKLTIDLNNFTWFLLQEGKKKSTINFYISDLKRFFREYKNENEIIDYIKSYIDEGNSTIKNLKTLSRKFNSLNALINFLVKRKIISNKNLPRVVYPRSQSSDIRLLSSNEIERVLNSAKKNLKVFVILNLLLQTGIKISEICSLQKVNLDLNIEKCHIKIDADQRTIPLNNKTLFILKDYINSQKISSDFLFCTSKGTKIAVRNLRTYLKRVFDEAKVQNATVNDLRNTFIVNNLEAGNSLEFIQKVSGHKSLSSTKKYLLFIRKNYKDKSVNKLVEF